MQGFVEAGGRRVIGHLSLGRSGGAGACREAVRSKACRAGHGAGETDRLKGITAERSGVVEPRKASAGGEGRSGDRWAEQEA